MTIEGKPLRILGDKEASVEECYKRIIASSPMLMSKTRAMVGDLQHTRTTLEAQARRGRSWTSSGEEGKIELDLEFILQKPLYLL